MGKRFVKMIVAALLAVATLFSLVACKTNTSNEKTWIDRYLCVEHTYGAGVVERAASCIREGRIKYTCQECGAEKTETLAKVAHTPYTVPAREATCAQTGYAEHQACAVCGVVLSTKTVSAKTGCTEENIVYMGTGVYQCRLCGRKSTDATEERMNEGEFYQAVEYYRFYLDLSESDSLAAIRIQLDYDEEETDGQVKVESTGKIAYLDNVYILFNPSTPNGQFYAEGENIRMYFPADDLIVGRGADYVDIKLPFGEVIAEGSGTTLTFTIYRYTKIYSECSNGAYVAMQHGRIGG